MVHLRIFRPTALECIVILYNDADICIQEIIQKVKKHQKTLTFL